MKIALSATVLLFVIDTPHVSPCQTYAWCVEILEDVGGYGCPEPLHGPSQRCILLLLRPGYLLSYRHLQSALLLHYIHLSLNLTSTLA